MLYLRALQYIDAIPIRTEDQITVLRLRNGQNIGIAQSVAVAVGTGNRTVFNLHDTAAAGRGKHRSILQLIGGADSLRRHPVIRSEAGHIAFVIADQSVCTVSRKPDTVFAVACNRADPARA